MIAVAAHSIVIDCPGRTIIDSTELLLLSVSRASSSWESVVASRPTCYHHIQLCATARPSNSIC
jgi:hypothetical protein